MDGQFTFQYPVVLFALILASGCRPPGDKANRPSPFASDTLQTSEFTVAIAYSSPRVRERDIWNKLVPYHKVWRTGANEATVFSTNSDLLLEGRLLPAGKYAVFTIPSDQQWTIIFNRDWDQWGAYGYDQSKDQLRIQVMPVRAKTFKEEMTFDVEDGAITFHWKNLGYELAFKKAVNQSSGSR